MQSVTLTSILQFEQTMSDFNFSINDLDKFIDEHHMEKKTIYNKEQLPASSKELLRMRKSDLVFDKYRFTVFERTVDLKNITEREIQKIDVKIFPLSNKVSETGNAFMSDVAGSIFDSEELACAATPIRGRKTKELATNNFDFIIRGQ